MVACGTSIEAVKSFTFNKCQGYAMQLAVFIDAPWEAHRAGRKLIAFFAVVKHDSSARCIGHVEGFVEIGVTGRGGG